MAEMMRADLADAHAKWSAAASGDENRVEREKSTFLAYRDDAGRVADFHSLRHTFISNLAQAGVHPKLAQSVARHTDINLTMSPIHPHDARSRERGAGGATGSVARSA
jgi:integrase